MEYNRNFSMIDAYNFLAQHGLSQVSAEIKSSPDTFKKYTTTLRRGKIIVLLRDKNLLEEFCNTVWQSGLTEKGKTRIRFFENLVERLNADQNGTISEDEVDDDEEILLQTEENQFAYENDLRNYLVKNLSIIEKGLKLYGIITNKKANDIFCRQCVVACSL